MGMYKNHKQAEYGVNDEKLFLCPDRVTFLSFDQWLTFYNADPAHWMDLVNSGYIDGTREYHLPVYTIEKTYTSMSGAEITKPEYRYIKFLTRGDFYKYIRFLRNAEKKGEDYQNSQEILALAEATREESAKRLKEVQERTQKAIDDNARLMEETRLRMAKKQIIIDEQGRFSWS